MNFTSVFIVILSFFLFGILVYSLVVTCDKKVENWVDYKQLPYGNIQSGAGNNDIRPISFYNIPSYRKPLNYPICHLVDYPIPHCRADSLS